MGSATGEPPVGSFASLKLSKYPGQVAGQAAETVGIIPIRASPTKIIVRPKALICKDSKPPGLDPNEVGGEGEDEEDNSGEEEDGGEGSSVGD